MRTIEQPARSVAEVYAELWKKGALIDYGKKRDVVWFKRARNFSKIVVVKITRDFQFGARLADRSILKKHPGKKVQLSWDEMTEGCGESMLEAHRNFPIIQPAPASETA